MNKGSNNRRSRGRGGNKRQGNVRNQNFDSNGPGVKVRGSAQQVLDKYLVLARDASSAGDRIAAESYFQYAEHYFRLLNSEEQRNAERNQANRGHGNGRERSDTPGGSEGGPEDTRGVSDSERSAQGNPQREKGNPQPENGNPQPDLMSPAALAAASGSAAEKTEPSEQVNADTSANEPVAEADQVRDEGQASDDAPKRQARGRRKKAPDLSAEDQPSESPVANDAAD